MSSLGLDAKPTLTLRQPYDCPDHALARVSVMGSACCPPGFVLLHAEPVEWKYPRTMTGSQMDIDEADIGNVRHDAHCCTHIIRVTVKRPLAKECPV